MEKRGNEERGKCVKGDGGTGKRGDRGDRYV
jgi:hypothetical protein